jgi:hypothetical protein
MTLAEHWEEGVQAVREERRMTIRSRCLYHAAAR